MLQTYKHTNAHQHPQLKKRWQRTRDLPFRTSNHWLQPDISDRCAGTEKHQKKKSSTQPFVWSDLYPWHARNYPKSKLVRDRQWISCTFDCFAGKSWIQLLLFACVSIVITLYISSIYCNYTWHYFWYIYIDSFVKFNFMYNVLVILAFQGSWLYTSTPLYRGLDFVQVKGLEMHQRQSLCLVPLHWKTHWRNILEDVSVEILWIFWKASDI